eukprot:m.411685 g.411685  ORF g.411685 m.411685 type:complete len:193 (-) comp28717_c0_seq1:133-711(-)
MSVSTLNDIFGSPCEWLTHKTTRQLRTPSNLKQLNKLCRRQVASTRTRRSTMSHPQREDVQSMKEALKTAMKNMIERHNETIKDFRMVLAELHGVAEMHDYRRGEYTPATTRVAVDVQVACTILTKTVETVQSLLKETVDDDCKRLATSPTKAKPGEGKAEQAAVGVVDAAEQKMKGLNLESAFEEEATKPI